MVNTDFIVKCQPIEHLQICNMEKLFAALKTGLVEEVKKVLKRQISPQQFAMRYEAIVQFLLKS